MFELSRDQKTLYVPNKAGSVVQQINVVDKIIEHEIRTGAEPEDLAVGDDGRTLYVTSEISDWVHVVDLEAGVVMDNIVVGTRPGPVLLTPDGKELWVANEVPGQISIIDRLTNQVSAILDLLPPGFPRGDVSPVGMTMTKDGAIAIITLGRANYIAFADIATRKVKDYLPVGNRPTAVALSRDEKTLYVSNGLSDDLSVVDMMSRKIIWTVPVGRLSHTVLVD
jgi:YVTN family beta-propeller protein